MTDATQNPRQVPAENKHSMDLAERLADVRKTLDACVGDLQKNLSPAGSASGVIALQGTTRIFSLPEILGLVSNTSSTGVLWVQGEEENFLLQIEDGAVVYARADNPPDDARLGEILIEQGALERTELDEFLRTASSCGKPLGQQLVEQEVIDEEQLRKAIAVQIQAIFERLVSTGKALFQFTDVLRITREVRPGLNITPLLLEGARLVDERKKKSA